MTNEHMRIDRFDCEYETIKGLDSETCKTHSEHGFVKWQSRYGVEYGPNRPCMVAEEEGVWLFYINGLDDRPGSYIIPYQMTFSLKGIIDIGVDQVEEMRLAFIRNGMNVIAAIEEWEKKGNN